MRTPEWLENLLQNPNEVDTSDFDIPGIELTELLQKYFVWVSALSIYAKENGKVYVFVGMESEIDSKKSFNSMINSNPEKEIQLEDIWINLKINNRIDNGPKISPQLMDENPDHIFVIAFTSKEMIDSSEFPYKENFIPIELASLLYIIAASDKENANGLLINPFTECQAVFSKESCKEALKFALSADFPGGEEDQ